MKHDIIFFPWRDWNKMNEEGFRTREANILLELSRREDVNTILCVNRSPVPKVILKTLSILTKKDMNFNKNKLNTNNDYFQFSETKEYSRSFSKLKKINEKIYVLDINYHIPNPKGNKLERVPFIERLLKREILNALNYLKFNNYLIWCFDLTKVQVANKLEKNMMIFDAIDNLLEHDAYVKDKKFIRNQYKLVNRSSDVIFTVSNALKKEIFDNKEHVYYIPNGINLDLYNKNTSVIPNDIPKGKPIIGYVGLMQERIDIEQLETVIDDLQDRCNFVFVGPILNPNIFNNLKGKKNVFFLGSKHHSLIPAYISCFDICILPHKVNSFTKSMNPLKLYEYLASGKETISTPVPPTDDFKEILHIVQETNNMSSVISKILDNPFSKFTQKDIEIRIQEETWANRVEIMMSEINNRLEKNLK